MAQTKPPALGGPIECLHETDQFLLVKAKWNTKPGIRDLQMKIAVFYGELVKLQPADETGANELITAIRALEAELLEMRKVQSGHFL